MAVTLNPTDIDNLVEEYHGKDGSVVVKYKSFHPDIDQNGFMRFNIEEIESIEIFSEDDSQSLYWDNE